MGKLINALLIDPKDNVVVAMEVLRAGEAAVYKLGDQLQHTVVISEAPIYHKIARSDIHEGEGVLKYGEMIGRATREILAGQHVHTHNLISRRENVSMPDSERVQ